MNLGSPSGGPFFFDDDAYGLTAGIAGQEIPLAQWPYVQWPRGLHGVTSLAILRVLTYHIRRGVEYIRGGVDLAAHHIKTE